MRLSRLRQILITTNIMIILSLVTFGFFAALHQQETSFLIDPVQQTNDSEEYYRIADLNQTEYNIFSSYNELGYQILGGGPDPTPTYQYALDMMDVQEAWLFTEGSPDVTIAVIDTGIDVNHPEFVGRLSEESYNARTEEIGLEYVIDDVGHGTGVAGVIGALKADDFGISGIVQNCELLIIKANEEDDLSTTETDESESFLDDSINRGIYYAVDHGADVINMSLGGSFANPATLVAVNYARNHGVILVAAAGNEASDELFYPASFDEVISVSAVDNFRIFDAEYSSYGPKIDVAAPGTDIVTTYIDQGYVRMNGTSLASPQVAGIAGLLISYYPSESSQDIIDRIIYSAVDEGTLGRDDYYGYGIVNANLAMMMNLVAVTFETYEGTLIDPIYVYSGHTINVLSPSKDGYTFEGWYKDELFTEVFSMGVDLITEAMTLYAKFSPILYSIHFITEGSIVADIQVSYGTIIDIPTTSLAGYTFEGWYWDESYQHLYTAVPVNSNFTLYARFAPIMHQVTFYDLDEVLSILPVQEGETFNLYEPEYTEHPFIGWYTDIELTELFEIHPIFDDINLYAKFDDQVYKIIFYKSDLLTIEEESYVHTGDSVTAPDGPVKASSPSFDYIFTGWSESYDNVIENLSIYPTYDSIYKPESIYLLPGVDTFEMGEQWVDGGTSLIDPLLTVSIRSSLDINQNGKYFIFYDIYDSEQVIDTRTRIINVIDAKPEVVITLNPDITTINQGDTYEDQGATTNIGEVVSDGFVDTTLAGVYIINYTVSIEDEVFTKKKYVYVISVTHEITTSTIYYQDDKRGWLR